MNVTKGIVAPSRRNQETSFFEEAFGRNSEEFFEILYMPENYIIYRHPFRYDLGYTQIWENEFRSMSENDKHLAYKIIENNDFSNEAIKKENISEKVRNFLRHYSIKTSELQGLDSNYENIKVKYDDLIKKDQFIELTLTYDFESPLESRQDKLLKATT